MCSSPGVGLVIHCTTATRVLISRFSNKTASGRIRMRRVVFASFVALWAMAVLPVAAQTYPTRPVHIVVTTPPGGLADITGRLLADELRAHFNEAFVVENRPGGSGKIGTEYVA